MHKGMNYNPRAWNLVFTDIANTDADTIVNFFISNSTDTTPFTWTDPDSVTSMYRCKSWDRTFTGPTTSTITCTFEELPDSYSSIPSYLTIIPEFMRSDGTVYDPTVRLPSETLVVYPDFIESAEQVEWPIIERGEFGFDIINYMSEFTAPATLTMFDENPGLYASSFTEALCTFTPSSVSRTLSIIGIIDTGSLDVLEGISSAADPHVQDAIHLPTGVIILSLYYLLDCSSPDPLYGSSSTMYTPLILRSDNDGRTWTDVTPNSVRRCTYFTPSCTSGYLPPGYLVADTRIYGMLYTGGIVYAYGYQGSYHLWGDQRSTPRAMLLKSLDGGLSWSFDLPSNIISDLPDTWWGCYIYDMVVKDGKLLASVQEYMLDSPTSNTRTNIFESSNGGASWIKVLADGAVAGSYGLKLSSNQSGHIVLSGVHDEAYFFNGFNVTKVRLPNIFIGTGAQLVNTLICRPDGMWVLNATMSYVLHSYNGIDWAQYSIPTRPASSVPHIGTIYTDSSTASLFNLDYIPDINTPTSLVYKTYNDGQTWVPVTVLDGLLDQSYLTSFPIVSSCMVYDMNWLVAIGYKVNSADTSLKKLKFYSLTLGGSSVAYINPDIVYNGAVYNPTVTNGYVFEVTPDFIGSQEAIYSPTAEFLRSSAPVSFTNQSNSLTLANVVGVAANTSGMIMMIEDSGNATGKVYTTTDTGITWSSVTTNLASVVPGRLSGITYNAALDIWIVAGTNVGSIEAIIATSSDGGATWTSRYSSVGSGLSVGSIQQFASNGANIVAASKTSNSLIYTSDGVNWTRVTGSWDISAAGVAYGPSGFIQMPGGIAPYKSTDNGATWSASTNPFNNDRAGVVYDPVIGKYFTANSAASTIKTHAYSTDLSSWTTVSTADTYPTIGKVNVHTTCTGVVSSGDGTILLLGSVAKKLMYTQNCTSFTTIDLPSTSNAAPRIATWDSYNKRWLVVGSTSAVSVCQYGQVFWRQDT